jgi:hypothetical protein
MILSLIFFYIPHKKMVKNTPKGTIDQTKLSKETYSSCCPSNPKFVQENKISSSFSHVKDSRTPFDLYWLHYYNQHADSVDYDFVKEKK